MDQKYLGKAVNLPKDKHQTLEEVRKELTEKLGFELSLSDTIAYLVKYYNDHKDVTH